MRLSSAIPSLKFIQLFSMHCLIISIAKAIIICNSVKVRSILYHTVLFKNRRNNFKKLQEGTKSCDRHSSVKVRSTLRHIIVQRSSSTIPSFKPFKNRCNNFKNFRREPRIAITKITIVIRNFSLKLQPFATV